MPYINPEARGELDSFTLPIMETAGKLNFMLTRVCQTYLLNHESWNGGGDPRTKWTNTYQDYNDILGALEACKLEFYRRLVVPYEDEKIRQNGDVY